jgi:uncharacterized membrane protein YgcG
MLQRATHPTLPHWVRYPIGGCTARVLRLLVEEAAILNSRDKAPFLLLLETQDDGSPLATAAPAAPSAPAAAAAGTHAQQQQQQGESNSSGGGSSSSGGGSGSHSSGHQHHHHSRAARHQQQPARHHAPLPLSRSVGEQGAHACATGSQQPQQAELRSQTQLEVQMQEAAALLRGESGAQLVRLNVAVLDCSTTSSSNGCSKRSSSQRQGSGGGGGRLVSVTLQVLAPAVPQLALPAAAGGAAKARLRRRLPSQEAIDIIAGEWFWWVVTRCCCPCIHCTRLGSL